MFCTSCGAKIESGDKFCGGCGAKLPTSEAESPEEATVASEAASDTNSKTTNIFLGSIAGLILLGIIVLVFYAAFLVLPWILGAAGIALVVLVLIGLVKAMSNS